MENPNNETIFSVTVEELQNEAMRRIDRKLIDEELYSAGKGIIAGLSFGIGTVFGAAIDMAVEIWKAEKKSVHTIARKKSNKNQFTKNKIDLKSKKKKQELKNS